MEAPAHLLRRQTRYARCRCISILAIAGIVASLVLIVPLAVLLPKRPRSEGVPSSVILPLYNYPDSGTWRPLYEVLAKYPRLNFTIIINPENGPGSSAVPSDDYITAVQQLDQYDNVRKLGYVRTHWATRSLTAVLQDISTYSNWSHINSTSLNPAPIAMDGIFFDETPNEFTTVAVNYLGSINSAAKQADGLQKDRTIVHNPGTVPDPRLNDDQTDIIIAFESDYATYQDDTTTLSSQLPLGRSHYSFMVHSAPSAGSGLRNLVDSMSQDAAYMFATDLKEDFYESFSPNWEAFISAVPR